MLPSRNMPYEYSNQDRTYYTYDPAYHKPSITEASYANVRELPHPRLSHNYNEFSYQSQQDSQLNYDRSNSYVEMERYTAGPDARLADYDELGDGQSVGCGILVSKTRGNSFSQ